MSNHINVIELEDMNIENRSSVENSQKNSLFKEIIKTVVIIAIIVVPIRTFVAQPFVVHGSSMYPTLHSGEYLIVDQISYKFREPERGDIIILRYPKNPKVFFVKRIIGLPNETISIKEGLVEIIDKDGKQFEIDENYVSDEKKLKENMSSLKLGAEEYFVMGDNRTESSDSRSWGTLERKMVVGRPVMRLLPISKIDLWPGMEINYR